MSKTDNLLTFYRQTLTGLNCNVTEDSLVQFVTKSSTSPVLVGDKGLRLALPTQEILNELAHGGVVAMHPMCENIILGQSPVIAALRNVTVESLTLKIVSTMMAIVMAIADNSEMSALQIKFASDFDKVDDKTVKALTKLIGAIDPSSDHRLINLYLKHGGIVKDQQYKRIATVTFPIYGELLEATDTVFGVKMRKQDIKLIRTMLEKIFPDIGEKDGYSFGSNSLSCPYFHALLNGFANVVEELNKVTYTFRKIIREYTGEEPHVTLDYIHDFEEGKAYKDIIPPLDYNQGTEAGGSMPTAQPIQSSEFTQPLRQDYQEQVNAAPQQQQQVQIPPPPMTPQPVYPQYPQVAQGYQQPQPTQRRGYISDKIKSIGATTEELNQVNNNNRPAASSGNDNRDLAQMMYPPEMYPQLQPQQQQMAAAYYPKFGANGQMVQPPQPQGYPQQGYPQMQQPGYAPQMMQQPPPMYPQQGYPQQMYGAPPPPQGYPQQGYPQQMMQPPPVQQAAYPKFGAGRTQPTTHIQNPNQHLQQRGY